MKRIWADKAFFGLHYLSQISIQRELAFSLEQNAARSSSGKRDLFFDRSQPLGQIREIRKLFSHARDLVFVQLIRGSQDDFRLGLVSKLARSSSELCQHSH